MSISNRQSGMTLTELLVVVAVMAILLGISVPTAQHLMKSFESSTSVRHLINAALSNARAIAVRNQAYAGVRFQDGVNGNTYMILIVYDKEATGDADGFKAVMGRKPMKFPEGVKIGGATELTGPCIVFSPSGKLTIHEVQCLHGPLNDTIFNTQAKIDLGVGQFVEDLVETNSVQNFVLSGKDSSSTEYISPYTGELVMEYRESL